MKKLLIVVDADRPAHMRAAVAEAVRLHAEEGAELHLLNVQPLLSRHVQMCFAPGELQQVQLAAGAEDLAPAQALLALGGVPAHALVRIGRSADTIARTARELGCDLILLGQGSAEDLASKVFGSLAQQLRHLQGVAAGCEVIGS